MLTDIQNAVVIVLAIAGAIFSAALGWLDSGDTFDGRKFASSMLRAFIAGAVYASTTFLNLDLGTMSFILFAVSAFLGGAGIDVLGNRASGSIKAGLQKATTTTTTPPTSPSVPGSEP